jgi:hypothetical protein
LGLELGPPDMSRATPDTGKDPIRLGRLGALTPEKNLLELRRGLKLVWWEGLLQRAGWGMVDVFPTIRTCAPEVVTKKSWNSDQMTGLFKNNNCSNGLIGC